MTAPDEYLAACVQFDVRAGEVSTNLAAARAGLGEAAAAGARLCVLPELWSTSFGTDLGPAVLAAAAAAERELAKLSAQLAMVIIGSAIEATPEGIYNTARIYQRGMELGSYRKIHLFSPNLEHRWLQSGNRPGLVDTELGRIGLLICYDLRFPELARHYFNAGAELLAIPGQWPEARTQHWRTLLRARAIENELFVIGCNRTGREPSARQGETLSFPGDGRIVDPTGEVLVAGSGEAGAIVAPIELRKVRTMRRILPVHRDQRPDVYRALFASTYPAARARARSRHGRDGEQ